MAKERKIKRDEQVAEASTTAPAEKTVIVQPTPATVAPAPTSAVSEAVKPVVVEPLDVCLIVPSSRAAVVGIRVVGNLIVYNDGISMKKVPIKAGIPITITMRQ